MRKILLLAVLVTITLATFAQEGTLRGTVIDKKTGETLIGATVAVVGTSTGTITDFDGNYSLQLAAGTYSVAVSFISYETKTITDVVIAAGKVTALNADLGDSEVALGEVVVTAKANKRTEASMLVMQRKSSRIMDGISAQQISKLGDSNAAAALKRVTGVSVQGGKYVYVRGLGDRYTKTTLNGAEVPALDPERNTVQMDMFPSNVIENIVVNKTYSPDMPGESTGGHIDVVTRDFPEDFNLQASASFKYNTQSSLNDEFITYTAGKYDYLGLDGGSRAVPSVAQGVLDNMNSKGATTVGIAYYGRDEIQSFTDDFSKDVAPIQKQSFVNQSYKMSLGDQISLSNDQAIGYNAAVNYSTDYEYFDNGELGKYSDATLDARKTASIRSGSVKNKLAALFNLNYKISAKHKLGIRFLRNQAGSRLASYREGYDNGDGYNYQERNLNYQGRQFSSTQLHGKHVFESLNNASITWVGSYTDMLQSEPDNRFYLNNYETIEGTDARRYFIQANKTPNRLYREISEKNVDSKVDFELPFEFFGKKSKMKVGSGYLSKERVGSQRQFAMNIGTTGDVYNGNFDLDGGWEKYLTENMMNNTNREGYYYTYVISDSEKGGYNASSSIVSGYALADLQVFEKLRVMLGARLESYSVSVENNLPKSSSDHQGQDTTVLSFLPSINMTFAATEKMNIRFAFSQTASRPVFREIAPQSFYDYLGGMRFTGNPHLKPSSVLNLDLRWELFLSPGEMIAVSGFYKRFDSPIERRMDNGTSNLEVLYFNAESSNLFGVEAEFRKKLDFIGLPNFTIGANVTVVQSEVKLDEEEKLFRPNMDTRPMVGQAPFLVNTFLGYNNPELNLDVNVGYNTEGKKLFLITQQETPYIYEKQRHMLNLSVSKGFGEHWSVNAGVNNLLDSPYQASYVGDEKEANYLKYSEGTTYVFGVTYSIK